MPPAKNNGAADRLKAEAGVLVNALADRAVSSVKDKVDGAAGRLTEYVAGDGAPGLMAAVTGAKDLAEGKSPGRAMLGAGWAGVKEKVSGMFGKAKGKSGGKQKLKLTNIVESIEVGVPVRLAYNQWTTYQDFPAFTKKVENARPDENDRQYKVDWKAHQRGEEPPGTAGEPTEDETADAADEDFADEDAEEMLPDEEGEEEEVAETRSAGDRRRVPARSGRQGRTPARSRQGTARGTR